MLINIGKAYIRAEDIRQINAVEKGTEEDGIHRNRQLQIHV